MPRDRKRAPDPLPWDDSTPGSPLERAQDLAYEAWETPNAARRRALAHEALAISPDCADAYLVLVDETDPIREAHALTLQAVDAGKRALGDRIDELAAEGAMWLEIEARPYMRAVALLASVEWEMGDRQASIARGWEVLRLNPDDNQGMRFVQLHRLLTAGSIADVERLLAMYEDEGMAAWMFGRALHLFRSRGPDAETNAALTAAKRSNRHVVAYLLGEHELPAEAPDFIGFGDEAEAVAYALDGLFLWAEAPGALEWLASRRGTSRTRPRRKGR